jgi:ribosomal protein L40E
MPKHCPEDDDRNSPREDADASDSEFSPEDDLDEEGDEFEDLDYDENDTDESVCPHCGAEVYDDADRCPRCGMNILKGRDPGGPWPVFRPLWPMWVIITAVFLAIAVLMYYVSVAPPVVPP